MPLQHLPITYILKFINLQVAVNTNLTDLHEYLAHLVRSTNMKCLTPEKALCGQCGFMAANMYARSIFGEDALANLSIEKSFNNYDSPVTGHIRIRAKSQVNLFKKMLCKIFFFLMSSLFTFLQYSVKSIL